MTISKLSVGMAIRAARGAARLSLAELSEKTGLNVSALSRIENGIRSLDIGEAFSIADVLGVDIGHIRDLASTFESEDFSGQIDEQKKIIKALRSIQQAAILAAIEASSTEDIATL